MTHVELLAEERTKYIEDSKEKLGCIISMLETNYKDYGPHTEDTYIRLLSCVEANLNKAKALADVIKKLDAEEALR